MVAAADQSAAEQTMVTFVPRLRERLQRQLRPQPSPKAKSPRPPGRQRSFTQGVFSERSRGKLPTEASEEVAALILTRTLTRTLTPTPTPAPTPTLTQTQTLTQ